MKNTNKRVLPLKKNANLEENTAHNNEMADVINELTAEVAELKALIAESNVSA
ncbi:hypothetical protein [Vibrio kanaloae]|uniref:hypothetical protein n=1 Tax=Vibrio kanaloae TaxID=170673 RepID=UPI00142F0CFA|nr:hypothetical protein [Vibrio kanaloae]